MSARPAEPNPPDPLDAPKYRPLSARRRLLIGLLSIATAITIALLLLHPPGGVKWVRIHVWPVPCAGGQTSACVGGQSDLILAPMSPPAPASASGAAALPRPAASSPRPREAQTAVPGTAD